MTRRPSGIGAMVGTALAGLLAITLLAGGCRDGGPGERTVGPAVPPRDRPAPGAPSPSRTAPPVLERAAAGEVRIEPGPFTDRLAFGPLVLIAGTEPVVRGTVEITSDVSGLLALEVLVDFYGADGRRLGSASQLVADVEAGPGGLGPVEVAVTVPRPLAEPAAAALLSVPQLANE